jgi:A/G-specific adenine glycosylase
MTRLNRKLAATAYLEDNFACLLSAWWEKNKEWYQFRETSDPYRILVVEMLLRKTRRSQVAAIHDEFFTKFPDACSVARSLPEEIGKIIKSLGLSSRVYDIIETCKTICERYHGRVPSNEKDLNALPGVGAYITNVVMTMGFDTPRPMIDSNVERVFSRILGIGSDSSKNMFSIILKTYKKIAARKSYREFHFALLDLSHQLCKPVNPACSRCPVAELCKYCSTRNSTCS